MRDTDVFADFGFLGWHAPLRAFATFHIMSLVILTEIRLLSVFVITDLRIPV
jgi:hypothetical protein